MMVERSGCAPLSFYVDHEIYQNPDLLQKSQSTDRIIDMIFPKDLFGDLPQSFSPGTFSSQCSDTQSFAIGSASFTDPSFPQSLPELETRSDQTETRALDPRNIKGNRIESIPVGLFWERYNEYPAFLKQLKKRIRRKNRRNRGKE